LLPPRLAFWPSRCCQLRRRMPEEEAAAPNKVGDTKTVETAANASTSSRGAFVVGAGPWWWGYPYWYDPWPYVPLPVVQSPPVYIEQSPAPTYWHYCQDPPGYYPSVRECPTEWMRVLPQPGR
jgi:hypothetical protein